MPRFMRKGITKAKYIPTIAAYATTGIPTTAEATAGTNLHTDLAEINGFAFSNQTIPTPDMASDFVSNIPGENTTDDSNMVFWEDKTSNPIKTALAKGVTGYIGIYYAGWAGANAASGDKLDIWPIIVAANNRTYTAANEGAQYRVDFATNGLPKFEITQAA